MPIPVAMWKKMLAAVAVEIAIAVHVSREVVHRLTYAEYATHSCSCAILLITAHTQLRISEQRIRSLASIALGAVGPTNA